MKPQRMLSIPLSQLIRLHSDETASDAKKLAVSILAPQKSALSATLHKFSVDLLFMTMLHLAVDEGKSMGNVIEFITDTRHKAELHMLNLVTDINMFHMQNAEARAIAEKMTNILKPMAFGPALRLVAAANFQWRKAFGLPQAPADSPLHYANNAAPDKHSKPNPAQIRIGTSFDLQDATTVAHRFLAPVRSTTDAYSYAFAGNLLVLTLLHVAHEQRVPKFGKVILFLTDNRWDMYKQIIYWLAGHNGAPQVGSEKAMAFRDEWFAKMEVMSNSTLESMFYRSIELFQKAMALKDKPYVPAATAEEPAPAPAETPTNSIRVFDMEALGRAKTLMSECKDDRRGGGDRILECAQANDGYRAIPDAKKAYEVLEQAKANFENLVEPLKQLQLNLFLAAAMEPEHFRVRPILLLGDPGIGKTYLAMALAESLGGGMEKMSAGGAQAAFQLNGSHSSWTGGRCGQIFRTLAESKTTSPVFIIDEIDKLGSDNRYPMLPVLLDLLEPETAKQFKDEFFEINCDASRLIFIMTANDIEFVSPALLSRVTIFNVQRPDSAQRLRIIQNEIKTLCKKTNSKIKLDYVSAQELADRIDIDLRVTVAVTQECFTKALMENQKTVYLVIDKDAYMGEKPAGYHRSNFGFCAK